MCLELMQMHIQPQAGHLAAGSPGKGSLSRLDLLNRRSTLVHDAPRGIVLVSVLHATVPGHDGA